MCSKTKPSCSPKRDPKFFLPFTFSDIINGIDDFDKREAASSVKAEVYKKSQRNYSAQKILIPSKNNKKPLNLFDYRSKIESNKETIILVHGYLGSSDGEMFEQMKVGEIHPIWLVFRLFKANINIIHSISLG